MPVRIEYKASIRRDLRRIDRKEVNRILKKIEDVFGEEPDNGLPLKGEYEGLYKLRVGDHRVIYCNTREGVLVLRIRHRGRGY